mgnify:CR=1 FL=1
MTTNTLPELPVRHLRNAGIAEFIGLLQLQQRHKIDVVVPASSIRMENGNLSVSGLEPIITDDGVTSIDGSYWTASRVDHNLKALFDVPTPYIRKMRAQAIPLLDDTINTWARQSDPDKKVLLRLMYGMDETNPDTVGMVRAILSDRYNERDNLDTALAVLDGMREAGLGADNIRGADLTEDKMYLRVVAPELAVNAPVLLDGYRSPFAGTAHGGEAAENPYVVYAGILVKNSETGGGALTVTPELRIKICDNGLVINADALRKVHLGGQLPEGQVRWSTETRDAANALTKQQVKDAVSSFLTVDYVAGAVAKLEETAVVPLADPQATITVVAQKLQYSQEEQAGILNHFVRGGQVTAGGLMQATTSFAQEIEDVDRANDLAATGVEAMMLAAAYAS